MKKKETIDETYLCPKIEEVSILTTHVLCQSGLEDYDQGDDITF